MENIHLLLSFLVDDVVDEQGCQMDVEEQEQSFPLLNHIHSEDFLDSVRHSDLEEESKVEKALRCITSSQTKIWRDRVQQNVNLRPAGGSSLFPAESSYANYSQEVHSLHSQRRRSDLSVNTFEGSLSRNISRWSDLRVLQLKINLFTGTLPESLVDMKSLQQISIYQNSFHGSLPATLVSSKNNLSSLSIYQNLLTGSLPLDWGGSTNLALFEAAVNSFHGDIPLQLYRLPKLVTVVLGDNLLSGTISSLLSEAPVMMLFVAQLNVLSGTIPSSLGSQQTLKRKIGTSCMETVEIVKKAVSRSQGRLSWLTTSGKREDESQGLVSLSFVARLASCLTKLTLATSEVITDYELDYRLQASKYLRHR
eukprot:gene10382-11496_t